jgi:ornithine cyclodeaminase
VGAQAAGGWLAAMVASLPRHRILTTKLVSVFPNEPSSGLPTHQAVLVVFDDRTGSPVALMDATHITAVRTAAASALATRLLARDDARVLAIIGTGVQARTHLRAVSRERGFAEVLVAGRRVEAAEALAREAQRELSISTRAAAIDDAVAGADVVCATTHAAEPVVRGALLRPGAHVNSVGVNQAGRELDADTISRGVLVVDSRAACLGGPDAAGANEITWAIRDGLITADHIHAELGELVAGIRPGRTAQDEITVFKSVGVSVQDAAAAALVLEAAAGSGAGTEVPV